VSNNSFDADDVLVSCPLGRRMWTGVATVCMVSFLFNVGDSTFHAFFSALLRDYASVNTKTIGIVYTLLACVSFLVSATISTGAMKRYGPVATCAAGMSCVGAGLIALGVVASGTVTFLQPFLCSALVASAALYYCGVPLYGPTIPTMLLRCVPSNRRGAIMGLDGAINTIARVISPLVMGDIYRRYGPAIAFGVAGVGVFGGVVTTLYRRFVVLSDRKNIS
jgi:MFS transporter, DHA1 family, tetracycline resistance protein